MKLLRKRMLDWSAALVIAAVYAASFFPPAVVFGGGQPMSGEVAFWFAQDRTRLTFSILIGGEKLIDQVRVTRHGCAH